MNSVCSTPGTSRSALSTRRNESDWQTGDSNSAPLSRRAWRNGKLVHNDSIASHLFPQPSSSTNQGTAHVVPSVHSIRPGQFFVTVHTLTKNTLTVTIDSKTRVHDVLWACGEQLQVNDDRFFGLALRSPSEGFGGDQPRNEYFFLDPAHKVFKYSPTKQSRFAQWTSSHSSRSDNRPFLVLYYRVRVYIDEVRLITCQRALEHYYIQLRENLLDQWAGRGTVAEERIWEMAALALRADKENADSNDYFRPEHYFPLWVIDERGLEYIRKHMPAAMADLQEKTRQVAMTQFCIEASRSPFALNCHLYGLRRHKMDSRDNAVIGVTAIGIEICDVSETGERIPLRLFNWGRVSKLQFDRKRLFITSISGEKVTLYAQNDSKARYLLDLCRAVHQCLLVVQHSTAGPRQPPYTSIEKSVDRSEMSNSTTSGIVSDRQSQADRSSTTRRTAELRHAIDADLDSLRQSLSTTASERSEGSRPASQAERKKRRVGKGRLVRPVDQETSQKTDNHPKVESISQEEKDDTLKANLNQQELFAEWERRDLEASSNFADIEERLSMSTRSRDSAQSNRIMSSCAVQTEDPLTAPEEDDDEEEEEVMVVPRKMSPLPSRPLDPLAGYPSYLSSQPRNLDLPYASSSSSGIQSGGRNSADLLADVPRSMQYDHSMTDSTQSCSLYDSSTRGAPNLLDPLTQSTSSIRNALTKPHDPPAYFEALVQQQAIHQQHPAMRPPSSPKPRWSTVAVSPDQVRQSQAALPNYLANTNSESRINDIDMYSLSGGAMAMMASGSQMVDGEAPRGRFTKTRRPSRHNGTSIARVQSMPAHYHMSHHLSHQQQQHSIQQPPIQPLVYRTPLEQNMGMSQSASALFPLPGVSSAPYMPVSNHLTVSQPQLSSLGPSSTSLSSNSMRNLSISRLPATANTTSREPPSYQRALEIQRCGVGAEARGQPSFPPPSATPSQFAPQQLATTIGSNGVNGDLLDTSSRFRDLPMLRALWAESQQTRTSLESSTSSTRDPNDDLPMVSSGHHDYHPINAQLSQSVSSTTSTTRRPLSMLDLSQADPMALLYSNNLSSGSYVFDSSLAQSAYQGPVNQAYNMDWSRSQVVGLPPPPPYPENRKAPMVM